MACIGVGLRIRDVAAEHGDHPDDGVLRPLVPAAHDLGHASERGTPGKATSRGHQHAFIRELGDKQPAIAAIDRHGVTLR